MAVKRTYGCDACGLEWTVTHASGEDPFPSCPVCEAKSAWRPKGFRTRGAKTRAIDREKEIAAKQYGLSDMNDGTRQGDIAAKMPSPPTTAQREAQIRSNAEISRVIAETTAGKADPGIQAAVKAFNGDNSAMAELAPQAAMITAAATGQNQQVLAMAKQATMETKAANGGSPMELLHRGLKSGKHDITRANIIARAPLS